MNLVKPEKILGDPYYDYHEISKYIESKYNIDLDDYSKHGGYERSCSNEATKIAGGTENWRYRKHQHYTTQEISAKEYYADCIANLPPYQNFWHYILEANGGIPNDSHFWLTLDPNESEPWVEEIKALFRQEFGDEDLYCYISW